MIFELSIKDFILIKEVVLKFDQGFNVLSGETGAGKSMVLGAINVLLGGQASKESVRIGADKANIRASFLTDTTLNDLMVKNDIPTDDEVVVISREIQSKGKSISRVNGQVVTLSQLKLIMDKLINIHGQNEHQTLLESEHQRNLLDAYGGADLLRLKAEVGERFSALQSLQSEITQLEQKSASRSKQLDFLNFQITEIEQAKLKIGEDQYLEKEFQYLSNLGQIQDVTLQAAHWLSSDDGEGALGKWSQLSGQFKKLEGFHQDLDVLSERFRDIYYMMEDVSKDIAHFHEKLDLDPEKLNMVEKRLDEINHLKSKYGKHITDILSYLENIKAERDGYEQLEELLREKTETKNKLAKEYQDIAHQLSHLRGIAAKHFEVALEAELQELNMKATTFKVEVTSLESMSIHGMDDVEFLISTNIGQPYKPLKRVVSGGELSRIMLGIKIVLGRLDEVPTLVFDEIDAGISGITANIVGEKLSKLAKSCQILCITHLPQIAVYADQHFLIEKDDDGTSTETHLRKMDALDREKEIGRLVGGASITDSTAIHAREMLMSAQQKKNSF